MADAPAYRALALQTRCVAVHGSASRDDAQPTMDATIERLAREIAASVGFIGPDCRLVVLPEYILTGHPIGEPIEQWHTVAAIDPGGAEYEALGAIAQRHRIHLAVNAYETDPHFPDLYFQACVILGPAGDEILRYRRLNSMFAPTPHDVWDAYLDHYGLDGVFPVARTEIGNLAALASEEIGFPELARCLMMRGAEVFCHSTSEAGTVVRAKAIARQARAIENLAYIVSANTAGIEGSPIPRDSTDGGSQIVDYAGRVLVESGYGESMTAFAEIDIGALRRERRRPGMGNLVARNRFDLYASSYADARFHTANGLGDGKAPERSYFVEAQRDVIERLASDEVIE